MKVEIRPIELKKWHGKSGAESIANDITIECPTNNNGVYMTGLSDEDTEKYGKLLGADLSKNYNPMLPHPFYSTQSARLKLPNHTIFLDTDNPLDYVKLAYAKNSANIAHSLKRYENGEYPDATHVIFSEDESLAEQASKVETKAKAFALFASMNDAEKARVIAVMTDALRNFRSARGRDTDFLNAQIGSLIESNAKEFVMIASTEKHIIASKAFVLECLGANLLVKEGTGIYYMSDLLGHTVDEAAAYLRETPNKIIMERLKEKLQTV